MRIEIKSRVYGSVLFAGDFKDTRAAVVAAGKAGANLRDADLSYASLSCADLRNASLRCADLRDADLSGAHLSGADLSGAHLPSPTMLLLASWGDVSPKLCTELMRYDAANCPDGKRRFTKWAKGGVCPYDGLKIQRAANFTELAERWRPGPSKSAYELMVMLIREKCADSDYHTKKEGAK